MASALTWLDYSERDRRRAMGVIDLFRETGTVDELGLAVVQNSFSDIFFPGISTIQTRACYFLLVPWTLRELENRRVPSSKAEETARSKEFDLNRRLHEGTDTWGVFGRRSGDALKRLPSEVYWGGIGSWGIRIFSGHKGAYFRSLDGFYQRVDQFRNTPRDPEGARARATNWHPHLPAPPSGFPRGRITVMLRREDAEYLRDRIQVWHPESLLAVLAGRAAVEDLKAGWPWELAHLAEIGSDLQKHLHNAKLFAVCMRGAALLYNLMLSELQEHEQRIETYLGELAIWATKATEIAADLAVWRLDEVWHMVRDQGRSLGYPTQIFVEKWVENLKQSEPEAIAHDSIARRLVKDRETRLKQGRARLKSRRHLELWGGQSGTSLMNYRWGTAKQILTDIFDGLARSEGDAGNT